MRHFFRKSQPTATDYLGLALIVTVFIALGAFLVLPKGSLLTQGSPQVYTSR